MAKSKGRWVTISPALSVNHELRKIRYSREIDVADNAVISAYIARGYDPVKKIVRHGANAVKSVSYYEANLNKAEFKQFNEIKDKDGQFAAAHWANKVIKDKISEDTETEEE